MKNQVWWSMERGQRGKGALRAWVIEQTLGKGRRHIRSDNGPEFIAQAIRQWLQAAGVQTLYIKPGSPWQNGYAESFHARLRDELLETEVFETLGEARALALKWRLEYNHRRPHSSLGYLTPARFAGKCVAPPALGLAALARAPEAQRT